MKHNLKRKKLPAFLPTHPVNPDLLDLQVSTHLSCCGIYDEKTYFRIWKRRILIWAVVSACLGLAFGGMGWMLAGAIGGMAMPVLLLYLWFGLVQVAVSILGYFLGVGIVILGLWALSKLIFDY